MYPLIFSDYPDIVTVRDLQKMLGISRHAVYDLLAEGGAGRHSAGERLSYTKAECGAICADKKRRTSKWTSGMRENRLLGVQQDVQPFVPASAATGRRYPRRRRFPRKPPKVPCVRHTEGVVREKTDNNNARRKLCRQTNRLMQKPLLATPMPPVRWIIPDLLPAGLSLLAGASKTGEKLVVPVALPAACAGRRGVGTIHGAANCSISLSGGYICPHSGEAVPFDGRCCSQPVIFPDRM